MNSRVKTVFTGVATGLALVAVLYNGSAVYNHYFSENHDHSAVGEAALPEKAPEKKVSPEQVANMKFTAEEMASAEKFAALQSCLEAGKVAVQLGQSMSAGGEFEMAETSQQAFDRAVAKCEAETGMTVDEANAFVDGLNRQYGDALETVYQNSVPPKPAAP